MKPEWAHAVHCQCIGCRHDRALAQTTVGHKPKPPRPKPVRLEPQRPTPLPVAPAAPEPEPEVVDLRPEVACRECGLMFRTDAKGVFCSGACRVKAFRWTSGQPGRQSKKRLTA